MTQEEWSIRLNELKKEYQMLFNENRRNSRYYKTELEEDLSKEEKDIKNMAYKIVELFGRCDFINGTVAEYDEEILAEIQQKIKTLKKILTHGEKNETISM